VLIIPSSWGSQLGGYPARISHSASSCFLLLLCFRKVTQEIFSELDKTKAEHPNIYQSFQKSKEETERSQGLATP
jgi:hypothetical protein